MSREWRENVWLIIELSIVCMAVWIVFSMIFTQIEGLFYPRGFNPVDVYCAEFKELSAESSQYVELDDPDAARSDRMTLISRLRENENVEAVATHTNGLPYRLSFYGSNFLLADEIDTVGYNGNRRYVSPDYIKVMGVKSLTGKSEQQLVDMLKKGYIFYSMSAKVSSPHDYLGKNVIFGGDSTDVYKVGDIIQTIRRNDYEINPWGGTILEPAEEDKGKDLVLRVKPGRGKAFMEDFKSDPNLRKLHNVYVSDMTSLENLRELQQRSIEVDVHLYEVIIAFLLITIFLGLLGTFWFRMQQRVSEIAIRKVAGARNSQIFRRVISEGMILLLCAVVISSAVIWSLYFTYDIGLSLSVGIILILELLSVILIAAGIVLSLWWPAHKAMQIEPALAIKDE